MRTQEPITQIVDALQDYRPTNADSRIYGAGCVAPTAAELRALRAVSGIRSAGPGAIRSVQSVVVEISQVQGRLHLRVARAVRANVRAFVAALQKRSGEIVDGVVRMNAICQPILKAYSKAVVMWMLGVGRAMLYLLRTLATQFMRGARFVVQWATKYGTHYGANWSRRVVGWMRSAADHRARRGRPAPQKGSAPRSRDFSRAATRLIREPSRL